MKKLFVLFVAVLLTVASFAQNGFFPTYVISDTSEHFARNVPAEYDVRVVSTGVTYTLKVGVGRSVNMHWVLASSARYSMPQIQTFAGFSTGRFVDTVNAQNVRGIKTFYSSPATNRGTTNATTNTGYGLSAIYAMTTGGNNVGIGNSALTANTTGSANTAVGYGALGTTATSTGSTGIGYGSLATSTGAHNTALGYSSLNYNSSGTDNVGIGYNANAFKTTGNYNVSLGANALLNNATGSSNIAIGYAAGYNELGSSKLIISNKVGGQDTAIIYGTMGATIAASTLQLNAAVSAPRGITMTMTDTITGSPVGTLCYRAADSALWLSIKLSGPKSARWQKISKTK